MMNAEAIGAKPWIETFLAADAPPEFALYHYTDQSGLLGILKSGEIWATNYRFLNDASEFSHARDLALSEIAEIERGGGNALRLRALGLMRTAVDSAGINHYVSSWSRWPDDLSQWRAYGGSRTGYAVGIHGRDLARIAGDRFVLTKCLYDEDDKREKMRALVEHALGELERTLTGPDPREIEEAELLGGSIGYYLNRSACVFKSGTFRAEDEWRLVSKPVSLRDNRTDVREGLSTLRPYYRLNARVDDEGTTIPIDSIRVGPCPHNDDAEAGVRALLFRHNRGLRIDRVFVSEIPYRNW